MRFVVLAVTFVLVACDSEPTYRTQIGEIDPVRRDSDRWRTLRVGTASLRAVVCMGSEAAVVGDSGFVARVTPSGRALPEPPAGTDLHAVALNASGRLLVGGRGAVLELRDGAWRPLDHVRTDAIVYSIAIRPSGLVLGGVLLTADGQIGWVVDLGRDGSVRERALSTVAGVFQVLPGRPGAPLLVVDSTPLYLSDRSALEQVIPSRDVHPSIRAMAEIPHGFVAVGQYTAWTIRDHTLFRELRQMDTMLASVAAAKDGTAVAVGRIDTPGGSAGAVAWMRAPSGQWTRELFVSYEAFHDVARCGGRFFAVGDNGLVAIRDL